MLLSNEGVAVYIFTNNYYTVQLQLTMHVNNKHCSKYTYHVAFAWFSVCLSFRNASLQFKPIKKPHTYVITSVFQLFCKAQLSLYKQNINSEQHLMFGFQYPVHLGRTLLTSLYVSFQYSHMISKTCTPLYLCIIFMLNQ